MNVMFVLFNLLFHKLHMNAHSHVGGGGAFLTGSESSSECARGVSLHCIDYSHFYTNWYTYRFLCLYKSLT